MKTRPKTAEEVFKLPIYQQFTIETYAVKDLEVRDGRTYINGKLFSVDPKCTMISIPVCNSLLEAVYHSSDDIIGCHDEKGVYWKVVKTYAGDWFRIVS